MRAVSKAAASFLSVHCDSSEWVKRAEELLRNTGADDIASSGEASADFLVTREAGAAPNHLPVEKSETRSEYRVEARSRRHDTVRSAADNSVHAINDLANQAGEETDWRQSVQPPQEGEPQPAPKSCCSRRDWPCSRRRHLLESHPLRQRDKGAGGFALPILNRATTCVL